MLEDVPAGTATLTVAASGYATATDLADVAAGITNWNSVAVVKSSGGSGSGGSGSGGSAVAVPTGASPAGWVSVAGPSVTMTWSGAGDSYEVKIYWNDGSDWYDYYSYATTSPSKTFWPAVDDTHYAFAVRAVKSGAKSEWTALNYFYFDN